MLARYFMYSQVYFHPIRRIYDIHLVDFLKVWLAKGTFSTELSELLCLTDNEVTAGLLKAASDTNESGHLHARRIINREHFKLIYGRNPNDVQVNPEAGEAVYEALSTEYGSEYFRHDRYKQGSGAPDFPVRMRDEQIVSSLALSETLNQVPVVSVDYVFAKGELQFETNEWMKRNREAIIKPEKEETGDG